MGQGHGRGAKGTRWYFPTSLMQEFGQVLDKPYKHDGSYRPDGPIVGGPCVGVQQLFFLCSVNRSDEEENVLFCMSSVLFFYF